MTLRLCLLLALLMPSVAGADEFCNARTQALLARLEAELTPAPTDSQMAQMREIARSFCADHAAEGASPPPPEGYDSWLDYYMLSKQPEKAGNRRLRNLKR